MRPDGPHRRHQTLVLSLVLLTIVLAPLAEPLSCVDHASAAERGPGDGFPPAVCGESGRPSGLDIADNGYDVVDNVMTLTPTSPGARGIDSGQFELINTGTTDLTGIESLPIEGLPGGTYASVDVPPTCPWNESIVGDVEAGWLSPETPAGSYDATVTVVADGVAEDSFTLRLVITELESARFEVDEMELPGVPGETSSETIIVDNTGNCDLVEGRVVLSATDLQSQDTDFIPAEYIDFEPETLSIPHGGSGEFTLLVQTPEGVAEGSYRGSVHLYLDGQIEDELELSVSVSASPVAGATWGSIKGMYR